MVSLSPTTYARPTFALAYAWAGVAITWTFWVDFVIFGPFGGHVLSLC
jgi:hypothetical protein